MSPRARVSCPLCDQDYVQWPRFCYYPSAQMWTNPLILGSIAAAIVAAAAFLLVGALGTMRPRTTLGMALTYLMPVIAATAAVYWTSGASSATTLLISCTVVAALLANGWAAIVRPHLSEMPPPRAVISTVLPIAVVLFLAGFLSALTTASLIGLALVGILAADIARSEPVTAAPRAPRTIGISLAAGLLPFATIALTTWYLTADPSHMPAVPLPWSDSQTVVTFLADARLTCVLAPALVAPLLIGSMRHSGGKTLPEAFGVTAAFITIALGILLPALVAGDFIHHYYTREVAHPIALPAIAWRLDVPLLIAAGFTMLGLRTGLIPLYRWMGLLLACLYALYFLAAATSRIVL